MALSSARFRGDPTLEAIAADDVSAFLKFGAIGPAVTAVQFGLIDLGFAIPSGATGNYLNETTAAVEAFQGDVGLAVDGIFGVDTLTALDAKWALPFADREEFLSWTGRPLPDFNFSRADELAHRQNATDFTLAPVSAWLPEAFRDAIFSVLAQLLDPAGSPLGAMTPSATWGVSPLDLYHCHVVIDKALEDADWTDVSHDSNGVSTRATGLKTQANQAGPLRGTAWTKALRDLLLAPASGVTPAYFDQLASLLHVILGHAAAKDQTVKFVLHTFEHSRPAGMKNNDARRSWISDVTPAPGAVTPTAFPPSAYGKNVLEISALAFFVDAEAVVTVGGQTLEETSPLVGLAMNDIDAAETGMP